MWASYDELAGVVWPVENSDAALRLATMLQVMYHWKDNNGGTDEEEEDHLQHLAVANDLVYTPLSK